MKQSLSAFFSFSVVLPAGAIFFAVPQAISQTGLQSVPQAASQTIPQAAASRARAESLEQLFINLNRQVNPGVVSVSVTKKAGEGFMQSAPGFFRSPLLRETPQVRGAGSGFVIDKSGLIVTNSHVVAGADTIEIHFKDNKKAYPAKLSGRDKLSDIALLKVNVKFPLKPLKLGDSSRLQVGQWVAAFGNPHGYAHTVTKGIISGVKREIDDLNLFPLLQTDAGINQGNSGGPLVNLKGEVIGVNNAIAAGAQGISFAIPINNVKNILQDILKYGYVRRGFIGVMLGWTPKEKGAFVTDVAPGSPAEAGGVQAGDRIIQFQKETIDRPKDLVNAVAKTAVGTTALIKAIRGGKVTALSVTVQPVQERGAFSKIQSRKSLSLPLGFDVINASPAILRRFRLPDLGARRPVVVRVRPDSPAAAAGLKVGDLISMAGGRKISQAADLKKALQKQKTSVSLRVFRYNYLYDQYWLFTVRIHPK